AGRGDVGEEAEAYADFLACAMQEDGAKTAPALSVLAIAVFASSVGSVEAYQGGGYPTLPREQRRANLVLVWHRPGHFEAVVSAEASQKADLTLDDIIREAERDMIQTALVKA
ncbi:unnamed protein product, partial [Prorocentrum cordatum]